MNPQPINGEVFFHVSVYPEWELQINTYGLTSNICRTYCNTCEPKRKMEADFEEYRLQNTPLLPSRKNCFYVCRESEINLWIKELTKNRSDFKVFRVHLSGDIFWSDASFLDDGKYADYWQEEIDIDDAAKPEGLFVGDYVAIEDISEMYK